MTKPIIGVFDSGVGGLAVVNAIKKALPGYEVDYREDRPNLPYGNKTPEQLHKLVLPIMQDMAKTCQVIVVACNTVTTTIIGKLRQELSVPLIGIEPMIKPAANLSKSGVIAVCATPTTLASKRYAQLKKLYTNGTKIFEPDCSDWTHMIENNQVDRQIIHERIDGVCRAGADVIVLACTHYHWIEEIVGDIAHGRALVMQPEQPVIEQLKRVLEQLD